MREITVLIIDEHPAVRRELARGLSAARPLKVVSHTGDYRLGTELAWFWEPDIILLDVKTNGHDALDICRQVGRASPGSALVVFTSYLANGDERPYLEAGASKCLLKGMSMKGLVKELSALANQRVAAA